MVIIYNDERARSNCRKLRDCGDYVVMELKLLMNLIAYHQEQYCEEFLNGI
jgi:hypothetical protein